VSITPPPLAPAGLTGSEQKPVKILGQGDVSAPLFVAAEAFTASARSKIEAAGGFVQLLASDGAPAPRPETPTLQAEAPAEVQAEAPATEATDEAPEAEATAEAPEAEATAEAQPEAATDATTDSPAAAEEPATDTSAEEEPSAKRASRRRKASEE